MHNDILTIGGKRLSDFQCWHDGSQVFRRASKQIEKYSIPGRSGDLAFSLDRHENLTIPFNCFIKENFRENYTALMDYLNNLDGYVELRTTEEPNHFREALFHSSTIPEMNPFNQSGQFTLEFDCKPQLWLDEGQREIAMPTSGIIEVFNPTYSPAYPTLKLNAMGNAGCNIIISDDQGRERGNITLLPSETILTPFYVDVLAPGTVDGYKLANGKKIHYNSFVELDQTFNDLRLLPGRSTVSMLGLDDAQIIPRWYRL